MNLLTNFLYVVNTHQASSKLNDVIKFNTSLGIHITRRAMLRKKRTNTQTFVVIFLQYVN